MHYSNKYRKSLFEKISLLSGTEHEEILKIIKKNDVGFTQNKNGIFFNISSLDDSIIEEIESFVTYSMNNTIVLDEYDKKLNECKINQRFDNMMPPTIREDLTPLETNSVKVKEGEDWNNLLSTDTKKLQSIMVFVDKMNTDREKIGRKKVNVKFYNAQKKYSKKKTDKNIQLHVSEFNELKKEEYL